MSSPLAVSRSRVLLVCRSWAMADSPSITGIMISIRMRCTSSRAAAARAFSVAGGQHPVALGLEIDLQRGDDILFIINDQNRVHRGTSLWE